MDDTLLLEHRLLMQAISAALHSGTNGTGLAELVIRTGWQTRPVTGTSTSVLRRSDP